MFDVYMSLCLCFQSSSGSLSTLVRAVLSDKKPEDVPKVSFTSSLSCYIYIYIFVLPIHFKSFGCVLYYVLDVSA